MYIEMVDETGQVSEEMIKQTQEILEFAAKKLGKEEDVYKRQVTRYTFTTNQSLEETRNNIALFYLASPLGKWGIELKENGKFIGTIDLLDLDLSLKKGSIGYVLNKDYWNQGLATEATKAVIALAFEQLGMNKLIAVHDQDNPASGRVMAKSGMKFSHEEAYAMLDLHEEGRMVTRVHYVLTKEEYLAEK